MPHYLDSLTSPKNILRQVVVRSVSVNSLPVGVVPLAPTSSYASVLRSAVPMMLVACLLVLSLGLFSVTRTQRLFTVISGSMAPYIPTGAIIGIAPTVPDTLAVGTVIAFRTSAGIITHRIVERVPTDEGLFFATKGDANPIVDPQLVADGQVLGRQTFAVPYAGYAMVALRTRLGFAVGILLPATLVVLHELRSALATWRTMPRVRLIKPSLAWASALTIAFILTAPLAHALLTTNTVSALATISVAAVFPTPVPSPSPSVTPTPTPLSSPVPTPTPSPSAIPSPPASPTPTPTPSTTPTPSPDPCDLDVTANFQNVNTGPGSTNTNTLDVDHTCDINQTNQTDVSNTIDVTANTGNNSATGNTNGGSVSTGNISVSISNNP